MVASADILRAGDILVITRKASVQFTEGFYFRLIRVMNWVTYHGWVWLEGYQLDSKGEAIDKRQIFVQIEGIDVVRRTK